ncbi:MAG: FixH family protein [Ferruginibacter sp.]|nr:FixH family protein [Chitinophagaceae bacterium]
MNWGTKILIVYVAFVAGIVFMVFKSSTQNTDLVTSDYYAKELKYQDKIDEIARTAALTAPVEYRLENNTLAIIFPKDFAGKKLVGEAVLYCPSDEKKDIKQPFTILDETLLLEVPAGSKGLFELHLSWQDGGVTYYFEKKIFI